MIYQHQPCFTQHILWQYRRQRASELNVSNTSANRHSNRGVSVPPLMTAQRKCPAAHNLSNDGGSEVVGMLHKSLSFFSMLVMFYVWNWILQVRFSTAELKYQAALRAVRVKNMHLKKCPVLYWSGSLLSEVQTAQWWNGKRGRGNTFNCDASCAACHAKLVSCHTGVEPCIRFGCIPYPKVAVAQNGDPVVKKKKDKEADLMPVTFTTRSLSIKAMKI